MCVCATSFLNAIFISLQTIISALQTEIVCGGCACAVLYRMLSMSCDCNFQSTVKP